MDALDGTYGMVGGGEDLHAATTEDNSGLNYGFECSISDDPNTVHHVPPPPSYNQLERTYSQENFGGFSTPLSFEPESNGNSKHLGTDTDCIFSSAGDADGAGPLLPDPIQMREEGAAFHEWCRQNAIYLEQKGKEEKELRNRVIAEAEKFKQAFIERRQKNRESNKALNIEREKLYLINQEKFHREADKQYWKAIAELILREVATIDKRRAQEKEDEKKPRIAIIQGPKPGKPTDLLRMRQVCMKLKQNPPSHMVPSETESNDGRDKKNANTEKPEEGKEASPA